MDKTKFLKPYLRKNSKIVITHELSLVNWTVLDNPRQRCDSRNRNLNYMQCVTGYIENQACSIAF